MVARPPVPLRPAGRAEPTAGGRRRSAATSACARSRSARTTASTASLLNGKSSFQVGPLDQGFWPDGLYTAPTDEALRYDIEVTKQLGFNMVRKHVKVEPDRWYYWCDRLGLLVWQDMPGDDRRRPTRPTPPRATAAVRDRAERDGRRSTATTRRSSCGCRSTRAGASTTPARITDVVKELGPDPAGRQRQRLNCSTPRRRCGDVIDIHNYPGPGIARRPSRRRAPRARRVRRPRPAGRRPHLGRQTAGATQIEPEHGDADRASTWRLQQRGCAAAGERAA